LLLLQLLKPVAQSRLPFQGMKALDQSPAFSGCGLGFPRFFFPQKIKFLFPEVKSLLKHCIHVFHSITLDDPP
jgi:hypothetical protein